MAGAAKKAKRKRKTRGSARAVKVSAVPSAAATRDADAALILVSLRASENGEHAAEECAGRAREIRISSFDGLEQADALAEEIRATNLAGDCVQIQIDLNAGRVQVEAMEPDRAAELAEHSERLDRQIVAGQLVNSTLAGVTDILESVVRVRDILGDPGLRV